MIKKLLLLNRKFWGSLLIISVSAFVIWKLDGWKDVSSSLCAAKQQVTDSSKSDSTFVPPAVRDLQNSFVKVADLVKPAVVNISAIHIVKQEMPYYEFYFGDPFEEFFKDFFNQRGQTFPFRKAPQKKDYYRKFGATGSGVIIDPKGYILTNYHVVRNAGEIKIALSGDKEHEYKGKVIGKDERLDLAVIKIKPRGKLPVAILGDSDKIRVGDWVIAVGSPFGLEQTVTVGIVSARRQSVSIEGRTYKELIQTDASINQGNSGGPLVDIEGKVIGINTAIYTPMGGFVGVGFAIPVNKAKEILDDLIHKGKVVRGWLGVEIRPVDEAISRHFGLKKKEGALVNKVLKDTPAEKGGFKRGDIILEFDGKRIKDAVTLQEIVAKTAPNKKVKVKIVRDKKEKVLQILTGEMPAVPSEEGISEPREDLKEEQDISKSWLGMKVKTLIPSLAKRLGLSVDERGVVIVDIEPGSKAEEAGLITGDCIRSINQRSVGDVATFTQVVKGAKLSKGVVLDINRRGHLIYVSIVEE